MAKIAGFLEALTDGEWHTLAGIRRKLKLSKDQIQQIAIFLEEYKFVAFNETKSKVKIEEAVRNFLVQGVTS